MFGVSSIFNHAKLIFFELIKSQSDKFVTSVESIKVNKVKFLTVIVLADQVMISKNYMVMELFRNDPDGKDWIFEVFSNFDIVQELKNGKKAELWLLVDTVESEVILKNLFAVKAVWRSLACDKQVHQLLCAMTVMPN